MRPPEGIADHLYRLLFRARTELLRMSAEPDGSGPLTRLMDDTGDACPGEWGLVLPALP